MSSPNDASIRQQIYLEGVKNYEAAKGNDVAATVISVILSKLTGLTIERLAEMTKKEFSSFVVAVRKALIQATRKLRTSTERALKTVVKVDYTVTRLIFENIAGAPVKVPKTTVGALWARFKNERISGIGEFPLAAVASYFSGVVSYSVQLVQQSYSNKGTILELVRALKGTSSLNYRDGAAGRFYRQFASLIETVIQHGSSVINQWLGRLVSDRYVWISVLDANTTDICRSRNGKIYRYGDGPQPPAHYRCRSKTRPYLAAFPTVPRTFFEWIVGQPREFLADVLGARTARELLAGKVPASAMPKYENALRISPEQYKNKISLIKV